MSHNTFSYVGKIPVEAFKCDRCGHVWCPRSKEDIPKTCPQCRSPYWDVPRKQKYFEAGSTVSGSNDNAQQPNIRKLS